MRTGRKFSIAIIIGLIALVIFAVLATLIISGPIIGNVFSSIINDLGDDTPVVEKTDSAVQLTEGASTSVPATDIPSPTANMVELTSVLTEVAEEASATSDAQAASLTDTPAPTLSTEAYGTAVANLATAQTSPTPVPTLAESDSGGVAGNADVRSYYNTALAYPNTMRITMELVFRQLAIAPTPLTELLNIDINTDIDDPIIVEADEQEEPPPARSNESINSIPLFVVAELDCLDTSFNGCEQKQFTHLNLMGINSWNWTIQPIEGISGNQNLTLLLYAADSSGRIISTRPLYEHNFTINVSDNALMTLLENNLGAIVLALSIIILGGIGYFTFGRSEAKVKSIGVSAFISYKRRGSWGIAEKIHDGLTARGVDTFIDSQDLHEGDFETRLTTEIRNRDYVVVVLVQETLQSEWVVKEIAYAFELKKTVIPVLIEGIKMEELPIPDEIAALKKQNAVSLYQKYFDAGMDEILVFLKPVK